MQQSLVQDQQIKIHISPQMIQAMSILQMSADDIYDYLQEQALSNPFLNIEFQTGIANRGRGRKSSTDIRNNSPVQFIEQVRHPPESLEANLLSQLRMKGITGDIHIAAQYLIGNLNEDGYLGVTLEETSSKLGIPLNTAETALACVQALEPPGVGSRTLVDCLQIQIRRDPQANQWAYPIVTSYLTELAQGRLDSIASSLHLTTLQVKESLRYIRTLHPRPGLVYDSSPAVYIVPEATIRKEKDGYVIEINGEKIPKVSIDTSYQRLMSSTACNETKAYGLQHIRKVRSLIHCLEHRSKTLSRIMEAILEEQYFYFEKGIEHLKPLGLKELSEKLHLHESTISRAIQNKYVQTPFGTVELKFFLTNGIETLSGAPVSAESVKAKIRKLVENENKEKPLSDQQITNQLIAVGLQISRRTVMKYREGMLIGCSRSRKTSTVLVH